MLRLLHLSDIHFKSPDCLTPRTDLDAGDRLLMIKDVLALVNKSEIPVNAILVTGDITFKASNDEFNTASQWLNKLAEALNLNEENIFVVPGNHDVNRDVADELLVRANRESILKLKGQERYDYFIKNISDEDAKKILLKPIENYNKFAKKYECNLELPNKAFWEHTIKIDDKYDLCLNGLTTTFFSSKDDEKNKLYMGAFQANFEPLDGTIHLAMFHHPKEWLSDGDEIEDMLSNNAKIWLSGHEHRQRYSAEKRYLSLPSAAVNPSRYEPGYSGYNIIDLSVSELDYTAEIEIKVTMRTLQDNPKQYVARKAHDENDHLHHSIAIPKSKKKSQLTIESIKEIKSTEITPNTIIKEQPIAKNLINRLWQLDAKKKRDIFSSIGISVTHNKGVSEENFILECLQEVKYLNLISIFENMLSEQELL